MSQPPWEVNHFNAQAGGQVKIFDPTGGVPADGSQQAAPYNGSNGNHTGQQDENNSGEGWDDSWNYSWDDQADGQADHYQQQPHPQQDWNQQWQANPQQLQHQQPPAQQSMHPYEPQNFYNPQQYANPDTLYQPQSVPQAQMQDIPLDNSSASIEAAASAAMSPADAQPAAPPNPLMPASNSFSKMPHEPSPFDNIGTETSTLQAPAASSNAHSRQSSYGNVQFIVGSENTSGTGTPDHSMHTSAQDLHHDPQHEVLEDAEGQATPVIEAPPPNFPDRRPPSVQSARSIDSIGHELRSQISLEAASAGALTPHSQVTPHASPLSQGKQPNHLNQASASPGLYSPQPPVSIESPHAPMSPPELASPASSGVNIFAQPIDPSPTSAFQPPFPQDMHDSRNQNSYREAPSPQAPIHEASQQAHPPPQSQIPGQQPFEQPPSLFHPEPSPVHEQPQFAPQDLNSPPPHQNDGPRLDDYKQSLSYQMHRHRDEQNMSPATTLWKQNSPDLSKAPVLAPVPTSPLAPEHEQPPLAPPAMNAPPPKTEQVLKRKDSEDSISKEINANPRQKQEFPQSKIRDVDSVSEKRLSDDKDERNSQNQRERQQEDQLRDRDGHFAGDRDQQHPQDHKRDPRDDRYRNSRDDHYRDSRDRDPRDGRYHDERDDRDDRYRDPRDDRRRDTREDRYRDPRDKDPRDRDPRDSRNSRGRRYEDDRYDRRDSRRDDRYRPPSRSGSVHGDDPYDRPSSRQGYDDYYDRNRPRHDDYRRRSEYDRPKSRQGYDYDDRPRSRQGFDDYDRPRSRQGFQDGDEYDRPRSRSGFDDDDGRRSRPSSRQGFPDDRPRSRSDYNRRSRSEFDGRHRRESERDYYRNQQDYYGQYGRQPSYGQGYYYDPQYDPQYYQGQGYYQGYPSQNHYQKGYQEEMNSYYASQGQAPPQQQRYDPYQSGNSSAASSRASSLMGSQTDLREQPEQPSGVISRGSTPGFSDTGADHFARDSESGSRPSSRASAYEPQPPFPPQHMPPAFPPQPYAPQYAPQGYYDPNTGYIYPGYDPNYGAYDPNYQQYPVKTEPEEPKRMTPVKFVMPHVCAKFGGASQLIQVAPNLPHEGEPALLNITELSQLLGQSRMADVLKKFPGPLIKGQTHKTEVTAFCRMKADECRRNIDLRDRESAQLIWDYLALLVQQNGIVVGTDIAQLLLEGRPTSNDAVRRRHSSNRSSTASPHDSNAPDGEIAQDRTVISRSNDASLVDRFRELLLLGRKKDALEWAMKQGLWGHALCLGSKMDAKTHASIMTRFTTTALKMTDPLQTLFQLMSHRQPAAVTLVADVKWDDWRPHLAMILSNPTSRHDVDTKSIVTLGDTLASRGCLFASHFCYLMAQQPFGHFNQKSAKLVLIGSSHTLPLNEFATSTAIQCTEIYEYGRSLADPTFTMPAFHVLKYLYTIRLIDHGLAEEAFNYCEVLTHSIVQNPVVYNATFVNGLLAVASKVKFYDPERLQSGEECTDPHWLNQLQQVSSAFQEGTLHTQALPSVSATPVPGRSSTTASSEVGDIMGSYPAAEQQQPQLQQHQQLQQPHPQQGFSAYQPQWGGQNDIQPAQPQPQEPQVQAQQQQWDSSQYYQQQQQQQQQEPQQAQASDSSTAQSQWYSNQSQVDGSYLGYMPQPIQPTEQPAVDPPAPVDPINIQPVPQAPQEELCPPPEPSPSQTSQQDELDYYKKASEPATPRRQSTASTPRANFSPSQNNVFQFGSPPPHLPNRRPARAETPLGSAASTAPPSQPPSSSAPPSTTKKEEGARMSKKSSKGQSGGWLGSLFSFKSKNEMKLPDDKNPTIVWDEATKSWKNTDPNAEDTQVSKAPPPTDSELFGGQKSSPPSSQGTPVQPGMPSPPSGSNRFSRQKTRGARGQYVDVFGGTATKSPSADSNLFNVLPKSQSMPAKLFVPAALESEDNDAEPPSEEQPAAEQPPPSQAPVYAPSGQINSKTFQPSVPEEETLSRCSSRSSVSMEVQRYMHQPPANPHQAPVNQVPVNQAPVAPPSEQQAPPPSMPMMFNPAQFSQSAAPSNPMGPPSTRNSMRYGQRRAYPK